MNFTHPAYHQAREFYQPSYGESRSARDKADLRTAIHWEPQIQFNQEGKAILSFYTADTPSTYEVRIEGVQYDGVPGEPGAYHSGERMIVMNNVE